jgi:K+ transporter
MILTLIVTIYFQSSTRLTDAYGLTVSSVSLITTILFLMVIRFVWNKSIIFLILFGLFLIIDLLFLSANLIKFIDGAWIALLIALIFFVIGYSWYYGQNRLKAYMRFQLRTSALNELSMRFGLTSQRQQSIYIANNQYFDNKDLSDSDSDTINPIENHLNVLTNVSLSNGNPIEDETSISVTPGVACFLTHNSRKTPHVFESYIRLLRSIPQMIIFLHIKYARVPFIDRDKCLLIKFYGGVYHISATFGYAQTENKSVYSDILLLAKELYQFPIPSIETKITFFIPNETILISKKGWRSWITRWPIYLYSIQKRLIPRESINIKINPRNTIQIGILAEL